MTSGRIPRTIASRFLLFAIIPPLKNEFPSLLELILSEPLQIAVFRFPCRKFLDGPSH